MSDDQIEAVLTLIEANPSAYIYKKLSETVTLVMCDVNRMLQICDDPSNDSFYLIYNGSQNGSIVACVIDAWFDLHVYVRPRHRGRGHLTKALQSVILDHILHLPHRKAVRISIATSEYNPHSAQSLKVARSVGFRKIPEKHIDGEEPKRRHWYIYRPRKSPTNG